MSDDRIKLPWESADATGDSSPSATGASTVEDRDPYGASEPVESAAESREVSSTEEVVEPVAVETGPIEVEQPESDEPQLPQVSWSSGAISRSERNTGSRGTGRGLRGLWGRARSTVAGDTVDDEDNWLNEPDEPREISGWLDELQVPGGLPDVEEAYPATSSVQTEMSEMANLGSEEAAAVLSGPRAEVSVPRFSRTRVVAVAGTVLILGSLIALLTVLLPSIRGQRYRSDLRRAFSSTEELRGSLPGILAEGRIPEDLAASGSHFRDMANTYAPYAKEVSAPPPSKPLVSLSKSFSEAMAAREALLSLNDDLAPAVDQVRARGNYLDTLAAIADQMRIAQSVLGPDGDVESENVLILEATVANATSLNAVLGSLRPPVGYEAVHSKVTSQIAEYVRIGREYLLAVKKEDSGASSKYREDLLQSAKSFEANITEPIGQGVDDSVLASIDRKSEEAARLLD